LSWHQCSFHMLTKNIVVGYANVIVLYNLNFSCFRSRRPVLSVHQQHCLCLGHCRHLWGKWVQHVKVALSGVHTFPEYTCGRGTRVSLSTRVFGVHAYLSVHVCPGYTFSEYTCVHIKHVSPIHVCPRGTTVSPVHICPSNTNFPITRVSVVRSFPHYTCIRGLHAFPEHTYVRETRFSWACVCPWYTHIREGTVKGGESYKPYEHQNSTTISTNFVPN
jgi:hypothetical protein